MEQQGGCNGKREARERAEEIEISQEGYPLVSPTQVIFAEGFLFKILLAELF